MKDNILVLNGSGYGNAIKDLGNLVFNHNNFLANPAEFRLILFTGGADVDPSYYGDNSPRRLCGSNIKRDRVEKIIYDLAIEYDIMMTGICRGVQFLNVMAGGKMMHHISGHDNGLHNIQLETGESVLVNSYHHQMVLPDHNAKIIGWSSEVLSSVYIGNNDEYVEYQGREVEAVIFPKTKSFGVQYHPEVMSEHLEGYNYYRTMVKNALSMDWENFITLYTKGIKDVKLFEICEHNSTASG